MGTYKRFGPRVIAVDAVARAAESLVSERLLLEEDKVRLIEEAEQHDIGLP